MEDSLKRRLDRYVNSEHTKTIVLIITNQCNLRCVYCYEENKSCKTMSFETAKEIIVKEMYAQNKFDMICVDFMGGEPFLQFQLMKDILQFLKDNSWSKKWFCFTTTNGTLVHGEVQQWLLDNKDSMEALLSLDGTREMHNTNRSNSYDRIDIDFFRKTSPYVKMTISDKTLPHIAQGIIDLHEHGLYVSANLGYGIDWNDDNNLNIFAEQLMILCDYYLSHPEKQPSTILDLGIEAINPYNDYAIKYCGVGTQMTAYDVDGLSYPCHMFAPITLGNEKSQLARSLNLTSEFSPSLLDEKCRKCPVLSICPTCYGINFERTGNVYNKDDAHCRMMKVQFLANAYFKYQCYLRGKFKNLSKEDEYRLLNNIRLIQSLTV